MLDLGDFLVTSMLLRIYDVELQTYKLRSVVGSISILLHAN